MVAKGRRPTFLAKVDPSAGPILAELPPIRKPPEDAKMVLRGRVTDPQRQPVFGAVVELRGATDGTIRTMGRVKEADAVAITDLDGKFAIESTRRFDSFDIEIEARGLAQRTFQGLATGGKTHELTLELGATVLGRLLKDGRGVANVAVGLVQANRSAGGFVGEYTIGTDAEGRFIIPNVAPNQKYFVYGKMSSLQRIGSTRVKSIRVGETGTEVDAGELVIERGFKLSGRVLLADGAKIPAETKVLLSLDDAWDTQVVPVDAGGGFRFDGVPNSIVSLNIRVAGYHLSKRNVSLAVSGRLLAGKVDGDIEHLNLLLEPGDLDRSKRPSPEDHRRFAAQRQQRLRGAEAR